MIKLTIVTPTFNRKEKLAENIESVLAQTYGNIEHVIIDNISDDGTEQLVEDYQKKACYPVVYVREKDTGIYNAMNKGIRRARGEWIHILNSDDVYYSQKSIEDIINLKNDPYDILCCAIIIEPSNGGDKVCWKPYYDEELKHYNFPHPGTVIKKSFYTAYGFYDERFKVVSDSIFNIKNYPKAKYSILNQTLVRMAGGGISSKSSLRNTYEHLYHLFVYHNFPMRKKLKSAIDHLISILKMSRKSV